MPAFGPIQRNDLIRYLKQLGFEGPYSGGKHQCLVAPAVGCIRGPTPNAPHPPILRRNAPPTHRQNSAIGALRWGEGQAVLANGTLQRRQPEIGDHRQF